MKGIKIPRLGHSVPMTTAMERLGHIKAGLKQTGSTKTQMWGGLKGSTAHKFSGKMKKAARGW